MFTEFTQLHFRITPEGTRGLSPEVVLVASVETLLCPILSVTQLAHLRERLNLLAEYVRQLVGIHVTAFSRDRPQLASHCGASLS